MQGDEGSIPGWEAKIPQASRPKKQSLKQKQYCNKFNKDFFFLLKVLSQGERRGAGREGWRADVLRMSTVFNQRFFFFWLYFLGLSSKTIAFRNMENPKLLSALLPFGQAAVWNDEDIFP